MKSKPLTNHSLAVTFQTDHIIEWSPFWTFQLGALPSKWNISYTHPCRAYAPTDISPQKKALVFLSKSNQILPFSGDGLLSLPWNRRATSFLHSNQANPLFPPATSSSWKIRTSILSPSEILLLLSGLHPCHSKVCCCNKSRLLKYMCVPSVTGWFGAEERLDLIKSSLCSKSSCGSPFHSE